jgi:hypothetical protein
MMEIIAFAEQRHLMQPCEGVGKTVAHVEAGFVAPFSIVVEGNDCGLTDVAGDVGDLYASKSPDRLATRHVWGM